MSHITSDRARGPLPAYSETLVATKFARRPSISMLIRWPNPQRVPVLPRRKPRSLQEVCTLWTASQPFLARTRRYSVPTNSPRSQLEEHLDPSPDSYNVTPFTDRCIVTLHSGNGGNGCVSFLRDKYIEEGPANGGDGGDGGSVFIQAVRGESSLHRIARKGMVRAGRGGNGKGKSQNGERGADVLLTVPVGTVVRELERHIPHEALDPTPDEEEQPAEPQSYDGWIAYPGMSPRELRYLQVPRKPRPRTSVAVAAQLQGPIRLDLDTPMERPTLLSAGAVGGLGNPNFTTKTLQRPKFATKGDLGMRMLLELELKMLADVGLVGLPNAGKSTLLRALTNSRTRVGCWQFTTLQPSIGTVVLDNHKGRPTLQAFERSGEPRANFTIADIPGLIENAHLDKGLGLGFLRHVERASVLAFIIDLAAGNAVEALKALWREVGEYETLRSREINEITESRMAEEHLDIDKSCLPVLAPPISSKPWLVVATKADLAQTQYNFEQLQTFVELLRQGKVVHPSGRQNAWKKNASVVPVSAIKAEGVETIPRLVVDLLNSGP